MYARIFTPAKSAMQSGRGKTRFWILEFAPQSARRPDPLMGWTSSSDTDAQIQLRFETKDQAIAYAQAHGIDFRLFTPQAAPKILKTYADNFAVNRRVSWTH